MRAHEPPQRPGKRHPGLHPEGLRDRQIERLPVAIGRQRVPLVAAQRRPRPGVQPPTRPTVPSSSLRRRIRKVRSPVR